MFSISRSSNLKISGGQSEQPNKLKSQVKGQNNDHNVKKGDELISNAKNKYVDSCKLLPKSETKQRSDNDIFGEIYQKSSDVADYIKKNMDYMNQFQLPKGHILQKGSNFKQARLPQDIQEQRNEIKKLNQQLSCFKPPKDIVASKLSLEEARQELKNMQYIKSNIDKNINHRQELSTKSLNTVQSLCPEKTDKMGDLWYGGYLKKEIEDLKSDIKILDKNKQKTEQNIKKLENEIQLKEKQEKQKQKEIFKTADNIA